MWQGKVAERLTTVPLNFNVKHMSCFEQAEKVEKVIEEVVKFYGDGKDKVADPLYWSILMATLFEDLWFVVSSKKSAAIHASELRVGRWYKLN